MVICDRCRTQISAPVEQTVPSEDPLLLTSACQALLNSNEPPRDAEAVTLRAASSEHGQRLKDLDEQILEAETALQNLKDARRRLAASVTKYDTILHPMRRLPEEVLSEIFLASICTDFWQESSFEEADCLHTVQNITQVSRRWRQSAIAFPQLWSYIALDLSWNTKPSDGAVGLLTTRLQRSRAFPLAVWLSCNHETTESHQLLSVLFPSSSRWKTLVLMGYSITRSLLAPIRGSLRQLETLDLQVDEIHDGSVSLESVSLESSITWFEFVPALKNLTSNIDPAIFLLPWSQLTFWHATEEAQIHNPVALLTKMENLQVCHISLTDIAPVIPDPFTLPLLTVLYIVQRNESEADLSWFLDKLTLPALQDFSLFSHHNAPSSIASLIERSKAPLQTIQLTHATNDNLLRILKAAPQLRKFIFAANESTSFVDQLIIKPGSIPLCPCLRDIYIFDILPCTTKLLVQMIHSRCTSDPETSLASVELELCGKITFSPEELTILDNCMERGFKLRARTFGR